MSLAAIFENFVESSPVTVMMRGTLERIISPEKLNELFDQTAQQQYTRELLFSDVVEVMMPVVAGMRPSVHASYQARKAQMGVDHASVYNKIDLDPASMLAIDLFPTLGWSCLHSGRS